VIIPAFAADHVQAAIKRHIFDVEPDLVLEVHIPAVHTLVKRLGHAEIAGRRASMEALGRTGCLPIWH
jgi:hypothetical protein